MAHPRACRGRFVRGGRPFRESFVSAFLLRGQHDFFTDVDLVWSYLSLGQFDIISDLAFEADIRDQSAARFRVQPGQVAGVRVAVGVTVHDIEEVDEIIAILNGSIH